MLCLNDGTALKALYFDRCVAIPAKMATVICNHLRKNDQRPTALRSKDGSSFGKESA
ncbi:hypothetical protein ABIE62_001635 [Porphyrobacter sp. MBR-155]